MKHLLPVISFLYFSVAYSQSGIVSGPMLGQIELRDARIWVEVTPDVKSVSIKYNKKGGLKTTKTLTYKGVLGNEFNPLHFVIGGLDFNTTYQYTIYTNGKPTTKKGEFTTKDLWQWRKPTPEFSFLAGSCAFINEPKFDRPGKPYGGDSSIFKTMAAEKSQFMVWLGDTWYTREVDYYSEWGLWYRAHHDRAAPIIQDFLKAMPHFSIWDDHDYGPNGAGRNYILKEASRKVYMNYFCNPSYGENNEGIYSMISWGDADIFLTDDRWWRSDDGLMDSVNGKPNPEKRMLGAKQMDWLKNSLLFSRAAFKIIAMGSQVLNPRSPYDKWWGFPVEYDEFMNFIRDHNINGVLFLTGDRHHSSIIKVERPGTYPLYDITVSPLTSGTYAFGGPEKDSPYRILGIAEKWNYGKFSFSGPAGDRILKVEFLGTHGDKLGEWSIRDKDLKTPVK